VARPARRVRPRLAVPPWWVLVFGGLGVIATLAVLVSLFTPVGRWPPRFTAPDLPAVDTGPFLDAVVAATASASHAGGTAELFNDGDAFYAAMLADIGAARRSVTFLAYIWEDGQVSQRFLAALMDRARRGVEIRLLLDAFRAIQAPGDGLRALESSGARVAYYRPARFGMLTRFHRRNHRRAIVVDGAVGFTGGAAVGDSVASADPAENAHALRYMARVLKADITESSELDLPAVLGRARRPAA
jgi:cardiolipin synthase A/B